jgi:hypothetical protein
MPLRRGSDALELICDDGDVLLCEGSAVERHEVKRALVLQQE